MNKHMIPQTNLLKLKNLSRKLIVGDVVGNHDKHHKTLREIKQTAVTLNTHSSLT